MVKSENCAILLPKSFMVIVIFECNNIFNPIPLGLWEKAGARCPVSQYKRMGSMDAGLGCVIPFKDLFLQ